MMNISTMNGSTALSIQANRMVFPSVKNRPISKTNKIFGLITLDLLGFVVILVGLGHQYGGMDIIPRMMPFDYSGLFIAAFGLAMTFPFLAWTLKSSEKALGNISL